jgi:cytochrome P450
MLAFGNGQHVCPGNSIARLEIVIAFEELLRHFPNIELAGDLVVTPTLSTVHIEQLPVVYRG